MGRCKTCVQGRKSAGPPGCCRPDGGNPALGRWDVVAVCAYALGIRVSDTEFMTLTLTQKQKQPRAKRHRHDARQRVSQRRPPARPPGGGHRKTLLFHTSACQNLKNPTRPNALEDQATRARCGVGLGRAGRLDAPEGNRREPKAYEVDEGGGRLGQSGAKAPDRNRSPARPRPTPHRASQERRRWPVTALKLTPPTSPRKHKAPAQSQTPPAGPETSPRYAPPHPAAQPAPRESPPPAPASSVPLADWTG